jgi:hypothetical protein
MGVEGPTYRQDAKLSGHALSACRAAATAVGYPRKNHLSRIGHVDDAESGDRDRFKGERGQHGRTPAQAEPTRAA